MDSIGPLDFHELDGIVSTYITGNVKVATEPHYMEYVPDAVREILESDPFPDVFEPVAAARRTPPIPVGYFTPEVSVCASPLGAYLFMYRNCYYSDSYSTRATTPTNSYSLPPSLPPPPPLPLRPRSLQKQRSKSAGHHHIVRPKVPKSACLYSPMNADKPYSCSHCHKQFKRIEHLKRHYRSVHCCEKPYVCQLCNKPFSRSDNLSQHVKTHNNRPNSVG